MQKMKICPKCSGSGKVGHEIDLGICYKCEGTGFVGGNSEEIAKAVSEREARNKKSKLVLAIARFIGKPKGAEDLWQIAAWMLKGEAKEFKLTCKDADLFIEPFVDEYNYVHTCLNPGADMIKYRKLLTGKKATISKCGEELISITF